MQISVCVAPNNNTNPAVDPVIFLTEFYNNFPYGTSDQVLAYGEDPLQFGELWLPDDITQRGLVILVHGGCWSNLYRLDYMRAFFADLIIISQLGYAVLVNRLSLDFSNDGGGWPGTYDDVVTAINFSRKPIPF